MGAALLTIAFWGAGQVLAKRGLAGTTPLFNNLLAGGFGALIAVLAVLFGQVAWAAWPRTFALTLLVSLGSQIYYYALARGQVALTGTVIACYPLVTTALAVAVLGERLTAGQGPASHSASAGRS